jgi:predicted N-acyltransferase
MARREQPEGADNPDNPVVQAVPGIDRVSAADWDALASPDHPFTEHAFLLGLEKTGCVGPGTAWLPLHLVVRAPSNALVGAAPCYLRGDSWGEFIFDFGWLRLAQAGGVPWYPKLTLAVPFTPATGPRALVHPQWERASVTAVLGRASQSLCRQVGASSANWLHVTEAEAEVLTSAGFFRRETPQARWLNPGYRSFDEFLLTLDRNTRKHIRHERRAVAASGLDVVLKRGDQLDDGDWLSLRACYEANTAKHGSERYLTPPFFAWLRDHCAQHVVCTFARRAGRTIAATLNFQKGKHLYGRYWGCLEDHKFLHFELAFYRLMDHCIAHGLACFEAGAGGEHKLGRGMDLATVHSAHWIADPELDAVLRRATAHERTAVAAEVDRSKR